MAVVFFSGVTGDGMVSLKNNNWLIHQNDPDNWIKIPEFNVLPQDVDFQGFAYPIKGPTTNGLHVRFPIWEIVKAVRSQAVKRFRSLADLRAAHINLIDRVVIFDKEFTTEKYSNDEVFAFRYEGIFYNLERCLRTYKNDKIRSMEALARAASDLAEMMIEKPIDQDAMREIRSGIGKNAALAKHATDPKQKDKALVRECWDAWQENPSRYKGKAKFASDMRDKFPNLESQAVIERWCRAWERKS